MELHIDGADAVSRIPSEQSWRDNSLAVLKALQIDAYNEPRWRTSAEAAPNLKNASNSTMGQVLQNMEITDDQLATLSTAGTFNHDLTASTFSGLAAQEHDSLNTINRALFPDSKTEGLLSAAIASDRGTAESLKQNYLSDKYASMRSDLGDAVGIAATTLALNCLPELRGMSLLPKIAAAIGMGSGAVAVGGLLNNEIAGRDLLSGNAYFKGLLASVTAPAWNGALNYVASALYTADAGSNYAYANSYQDSWNSALNRTHALGLSK